MKKQLIYILLLPLLWSCSKYDNPPTADKVAVSFSAKVGKAEVQNGNRSVTSSWYDGAKIGITMLKNGTGEIAEAAANCLYTHASDGRFSCDAANTIYYPVNGSLVDFVAYHPHNASASGAGAFAVDVSVQDKQQPLDLLFARIMGKDKMNPGVQLDFAHCMSKLTMHIKPGYGLTGTDLQGLKVEVKGMNTRAMFATADGSLTEPGIPASILLNTAADGTSAEGIILPAEAGTYSFVFTLQATGEPFVWTITAGKVFKAGDENVYNVTLARTGISVETSVNDWAPGNNGGEVIEAE